MLRSDRVTSVRAWTRCQSLELWVQIGDREVVAESGRADDGEWWRRGRGTATVLSGGLALTVVTMSHDQIRVEVFG
jgi:hypothetical protein